MKISTHPGNVVKCFIVLVFFYFAISSQVFAQKYWRGSVSTDWTNGANWSPTGAPVATDDVIIGDASMTTGIRQPEIDVVGDITIKSLTIGDGTKAASLFLSANSLTVTGNVVIGANGKFENNGTIAYYRGNLTVKSGAIYKESAYSSNNGRGSGSKVWPVSEFSSATAEINFEPTTSGLGNLIISGKVTLLSNLTITQTNAYKTNNVNQIISTEKPQLNITASGSLDPGTFKVKFVDGTSQLAPVFTVAENGIVYVKAATYAGNFAKDGGAAMFPTTLSALGVVNYAGTIDQEILPSVQYGVLRVSGKSPVTTTTIVKKLGTHSSTTNPTTIASNLYVDESVLDIEGYILNRTALGGTMNVANGATLKLSGASNFPANFATVDLGSSSTVEYYGAAQTVTNVTKGYGNLHLIGSGAKTMPSIVAPGSLVIAGNLKGAGSATFTAASNLDIAGNVDLSGTASFNGGSFTHTVGGDWLNEADFTGGTSTVRLFGTGKQIKRTVALGASLKNEFNNLQVTGLGTSIVIPATQTLTVRGNLETSGAGTLTQASGGLIMTDGTSGAPKTIAGSGITLNNLSINGYVTTGASFLVNGNFATSATGSFTATAGTVTMGSLNKSTSYSIDNAGITQFFGLNIARTTSESAITTASSFSIASDLSGNKLNATAGTTTFNGNSTFGGEHQLNNVAITGSMLRMASASSMSIKSSFTGAASSFVATSPNTVIYNGAAQNVNNVTYYNLQLAGSNTKTADGNVETFGTFTVGAGVTFGAGNYTHTLHGNWVHNGTYSGTSSSLIFAGTSDAAVSGTSPQTAIVVASVTVNKAATSVVTTGFNITTNTLALTGGSISTLKAGVDPFGASALVIKVLQSRSGNGWVIGKITREITAGFQEETITETTGEKSISVGVGNGYNFNGPLVKIIFPTLAAGTQNITTPISRISVTTVPQIVQGVTSGVPINRLFKVEVENGAYTKAILQIQYEESELNGNTERDDEEGLKLASSTSSTSAISWGAGLKHDWNIDENRVARKDITDLNRYWTLTDQSNLYVWKGSLSNAWETQGNWKMIDATGLVYENATSLPTTSDVVELGSISPIPHQPHIKSEAKVKGLQFKAATAMTLSIDSTATTTPAYSLLVRGNLSALGTGTANHKIKTANRDLTVNGSLITENDNQVIHISKSAGNITVKGSINQNKANIYLNSGNLFVGGDYIKAGTGGFTTTTGTVTYNGGAAQTVADLPYYNLAVNKTGGAAQYTTTGNKTILGNLSVANGTLVLQSSIAAPGTVTVYGNVAIGDTGAGTSGTLNATNSIISLKGNWNRVAGSFVPGTGRSYLRVQQLKLCQGLSLMILLSITHQRSVLQQQATSS